MDLSLKYFHFLPALVPLVLRSCSEFVESHGIVDGIYRLSGVSSNIQKLRLLT
uniref:Rho-GAP domain-containing protein n=1 Tax=Neogobius melanostomus TaxID=47308 RepID=A0A8C6SRD1_9GOBI